MLRSSLFWCTAQWTLATSARSFVSQTGRTDCGVASALTVLRLLARPADPVAAVEELDPDRSGTSLEALRRYFHDQHGLQAKALSVPPDRVAGLSGRIILHMAQQHYVVLLRAGRNGFLVFDPAMGPVFYAPDDFASLYSGHLLQITPSGQGRAAIPAKRTGRATTAAVVGGPTRRSIEPVALFIVGFATRLLEAALLLCLVAVLYLVLNQASFPSLLTAFGLIAVCGGLLLVAHQVRFDAEDRWIRRAQSRLWRGVLRATMRGRDLSGFRGRLERDVSGALRKGLSVSVPQRSQLPASLGSVVAVPVLLCLLHPAVALVYLILFGLVLTVVQLDAVQVCRRSVQGGIGRYSKLSLGRDLISAVSAPDLIAEIAKWTVIGFAGFSVLLNDLPAVALMFWILASMQIVPNDFRRAMQLAPALAAREPVSALTASEVPLRPQQIVGPVDLTVQQDQPGLTRIDGITPLMRNLQQPDLTVREQRLIMADAVRYTLDSLPVDGALPQIGPIRIFGPGQDANQADFEHLMIARETRQGQTLPVPANARKVFQDGAGDRVLRDLHSCEPGDFPVFWDYRERLAVTDLQARLTDLGLTRAGHLTMKRLTLVEAA